MRTREITGWLLDVYPDEHLGAVLWILGDDHLRYRFQHPFPVSFYVAGPSHRLRQLWRSLRKQYPNSIRLSKSNRNDLFSGQTPVLSATVQNPLIQPKIFYAVYRQFPDLSFYNADILFSLRHAAKYNTYPLARCRITAEAEKIIEIEVLSSPTSLDTEIPTMRIMTLAPDTDPEYIDPTALIVSSGNEQRTLSLNPPDLFLQRLNRLIQEFDPDIILTKWGDTWLFPLALRWSKQFSIKFNPNRDKNRKVIRRSSFSYHSYGRVLHRGEQVHLLGRWHIDQTNAVMYGEYQLMGVLEQARITGLPVQDVARKSPGAGITAMQMITAMRKKILIPYHKQQVETFKTPAQMVAADRGGLVGQPVSGVHYQVAGIDFFSMYPQIMARYNISPETITDHDLQTIHVPGTGTSIDQTTVGFIGQSLQSLLIRRYLIKQQMNKLHPLDSRYANLKARSNALKWLLVVCFGYLGHKHFRWMKIEAHESVTAIGREVLLLAKGIAEQHGFRVLYYNVDGLYIQKQGCNQSEDFSQVLAEIRARTGLLISLDGIYRWIAFLPSRTNHSIPVANRYFGMFDDGKLKVRGLEVRRHDTPPLIYKTQMELLHSFTKVKEGQPLEKAIPRALKLLETRAQQLRAGQIPLDDLVVAQRLSRDLSQYRQPSPAAKAAAQLHALDKPMHAGQVVHFLFVKKSPGVLAWRAGAPFDYHQINIAEYLKLLARSASNVL
ncbi:MAG: hypothetical protein GWN62_29595, partial [Aliifodinibius sp.]|nr:hypothetical protein [Fodinibius sp.]